MKYSSVLVFTIAISACIALSHQQAATCELFNPELINAHCRRFIPTHAAYVPAGITLDQKITAMNAYTVGLVGVPNFGLCYEVEIWWNCVQTNPKFYNFYATINSCVVDAYGIPIQPATPIPICMDFCTYFMATCKDIYIDAGTYPQFGDGYCNSLNLTNDGIKDTPCINYTGIGNFTTTVANNGTCNFPLIPFYFNGTAQAILGNVSEIPYLFNANNSNACAPPCPSMELSESQIWKISLMPQIMGWMSFVALTLSICFFLSVKALRTYPLTLIIYFFISAYPLAIAFMLYSFTGGYAGKVWCGKVDAFNIKRVYGVNNSINDSGECVFQAWLIVYGTLSATAWWAVIGFNTAMRIIRDNPLPRWTEVVYHVICWGVPLVCAIITTAANQMNYQATNIYCFISTNDHQWWRIWCWFVPMGVFFVAGTIFMGVFIYYLFLSITRGVEKTGNTGNTLDSMTRIIICLIYIWVSVILIFASQILNSSEIAKNYIAINLQYLCLLSGNSDANCRDILNENTNIIAQFGLAGVSVFFMASMGLAITLIFTTTPRIFGMCGRKIGSLSSNRSKSSISDTTGAISSNAGMHSSSSSNGTIL